jgi:hypothetical protein
MRPAKTKHNPSPAPMLHATHAGRTSGIEELIVIVLVLIGLP